MHFTKEKITKIFRVKIVELKERSRNTYKSILLRNRRIATFKTRVKKQVYIKWNRHVYVGWVLIEFPRSNALQRLLQITFFKLSSAILRSLVLLWGFVCLIEMLNYVLCRTTLFFMLHEMFFFNRRWSLALADFKYWKLIIVGTGIRTVGGGTFSQN